VIDGAVHALGSDKAAIERRSGRRGAELAAALPVTIERSATS
jgi:hypothetical protein